MAAERGDRDPPPGGTDRDGGLRVVIVGATGNIGTALVERLAGDDAIGSVLGVARRRPGLRVAKTDWAVADITSDDLAPLMTGADAVVHLAWAFQPTHDPVETWKVNAVGSQRVFEAAARAGVGTLVYSSSVGAYSPKDGHEPVAESWPTDSLPTAGYGREKAYVERVLDGFEARNPDIRVVRMRPGFVFQDGAASEQWRIFAGQLLPPRVARSGLVPAVPLDRRLRLQVVHAADVAEAFRLALVTPVHGAFNVAAEPVLTAADIASALDARLLHIPRPLLRAVVAIGWHLRVVAASPHLLDLSFGLPVMDTTRAREELGWSPKWSARDALAALVRGLAHERGAATPPLEPPDSGETVAPAGAVSDRSTA